MQLIQTTNIQVTNTNNNKYKQQLQATNTNNSYEHQIHSTIACNQYKQQLYKQ